MTALDAHTRASKIKERLEQNKNKDMVKDPLIGWPNFSNLSYSITVLFPFFFFFFTLDRKGFFLLFR